MPCRLEGNNLFKKRGKIREIFDEKKDMCSVLWLIRDYQPINYFQVEKNKT